MSATPIGDRLKLHDALAAAECIRGMWGLDPETCLLVGSARREAISVGDLEFCAPMPAPGTRDELFERMDLTMQTGGLFGAGTVPVAQPLKGFRNRFYYCDTRVDLTHQETGKELSVRVQIHRYEADGSNRGWIELMRTGPSEFGEWFLAAWKAFWKMPIGRRASIDGHLVNDVGARVPTPTEADCFRQIGMAWISPDRRDAFAEAARHRSRWFRSA